MDNEFKYMALRMLREARYMYARYLWGEEMSWRDVLAKMRKNGVDLNEDGPRPHLGEDWEWNATNP